MISPNFSINQYDSDGDVVTEGIFLHFGDTSIKVADDLKEFDLFIDKLKSIKSEITATFIDVNGADI